MAHSMRPEYASLPRVINCRVALRGCPYMFERFSQILASRAKLDVCRSRARGRVTDSIINLI